MSSQRVQRIFEAVPARLRELGAYDINFKEAVRWAGRVSATTDGFKDYDAVVIDLSSQTWATLNKRIIIVAEPAMDYTQSAQFRTQSHTAGQYIDGSVKLHVFAESPIELFGANAANKEFAKFLMNVQTHLVGQMGAPMQLHIVDAGIEPQLDGVNGASSTTAFEDMGWILPYGMTYPGGI